MDLSLRLENLTIATYNGRIARAGDAYPLSKDPCYPTYWHFLGALIRVPVQASNENGFARGTSHFLYAWNMLMGFPKKTDPDVFRTIRHLDIEGLQDYRMSLINGSRRTLAGN